MESCVVTINNHIFILRSENLSPIFPEDMDDFPWKTKETA